jgi:methionine-rich copper-binding protein CopC
MTCRWVTESRITTFGRRVIITSAVFGLTTMGSAGIAVAASDTVGVSPSAKVVAVAPTAVSVTFREALRSGGAQLRVLSADGEVGTGKVTTGQKTLRRSLRLGAPQGSYTVEWKAVSVKGKRMSGSFTFFAARSNGDDGSRPRSDRQRPGDRPERTDRRANCVSRRADHRGHPGGHVAIVRP